MTLIIKAQEEIEVSSSDGYVYLETDKHRITIAPENVEAVCVALRSETEILRKRDYQEFVCELYPGDIRYVDE